MFCVSLIFWKVKKMVFNKAFIFNIYIFHSPTFRTPPPGSATGMDRQNIMRLKVNRIALVQELRVEHITGLLKDSGVISSKDLRKIENGRTPQVVSIDLAILIIGISITSVTNNSLYIAAFLAHRDM